MKWFILDQSNQKKYQSNENTKPLLKTGILTYIFTNNKFFFYEEPNNQINENSLKKKGEINISRDDEGLFYSFKLTLNVFFL